MELDSLKNIPKTFTTIKIALFTSFALCVLISFGSMLWSYRVSTKYIDTTYLLTNDGKAILINSIDKYQVDQTRKPEIIDHIKVFHKHFFEIDQFNYEQRIDKALHLIGSSGKDLYLTRKHNGHYSDLLSNNFEHHLQIDSIKVDDSSHPYRGEFYGKVIVKRTDNQLESVNNLYTSFRLQNISRSEKNPHGLLIENYMIKTY
ncbi:hypothetical protein [Aquimarina sp. RZ0]|uniref:hypothetical protein n=1 Tax=Aquimarina sp. RZ0 TaxID=2607730 RepID=UPI0011F23C49|nr:hypothetical protein [Aquimarina sp. RZ0]KAA1246741.1 hypothetical protein F0000_06795 [Aquimarina sp. RZ0]